MSLSLIATQWTTPKTTTQRPWILWSDWQDIIAYLDIKTVRVDDSGYTTPAVMEFDLVDRTNTVYGLIAKQQRLLYVETQANSNAGRIVFHGFIKSIQPRLTAAYSVIHVTAVDLSEFLDCSFPIDTMTRPIEADSARIGSVIGNYCTWSGMLGGGFVQTLDPALSASDIGHSSVRNAIEDTLNQAEITPVGYYVDKFGYLHTFQIADGGAAPYNISDTPNYATTIPANLSVTDDGSQDADGMWINGGKSAGSGEFLDYPTNGPRWPHRVATMDAPDALDRPTGQSIATTELDNRQNLVNVTAVVSADSAHGSFDGWEKGQSITVTNAVLGWVNQPLVVQGVSWQFLNGLGQRRYTLTLGNRPAKRGLVGHLIGRIRAQQTSRRISGQKISGNVGSPRKNSG